jgi:hypothetical protein
MRQKRLLDLALLCVLIAAVYVVYLCCAYPTYLIVVGPGLLLLCLLLRTAGSMLDTQLVGVELR